MATIFGALGRRAREFERALHRFGPAVGEEGNLQIAGRDFGEPARQTAHERVEHRAAGERHRVELRAHRGDDPRVTMTDGEDAVAPGEVEIRLAGMIADRAAVGADFDRTDPDSFITRASGGFRYRR